MDDGATDEWDVERQIAQKKSIQSTRLPSPQNDKTDDNWQGRKKVKMISDINIDELDTTKPNLNKYFEEHPLTRIA